MGLSASFFSSHIKALRKETRKAFNKAKDRNLSNIAIRRIAQKIYSKEFRRNKRMKEQQLYNSVNSDLGASNAFKSLAKDPICSIGTLKCFQETLLTLRYRLFTACWKFIFVNVLNLKIISTLSNRCHSCRLI